MRGWARWPAGLLSSVNTGSRPQALETGTAGERMRLIARTTARQKSKDSQSREPGTGQAAQERTPSFAGTWSPNLAALASRWPPPGLPLHHRLHRSMHLRSRNLHRSSCTPKSAQAAGCTTPNWFLKPSRVPGKRLRNTKKSRISH